ncbi:methyl transferase [Pseudoalteromonas phage KB12-38]|nr:methyl transferase [Pseudoalteromonas phage KB12-38]
MSQVISPNVLNVLMASTIDGHALKLPDRQLDRQLYLAVDKVLKALGGKWNRSKKAHVFTSSPDEKLELAVQTGSYTDNKKLFQFFETPEPLAKVLIDLAGDLTGKKVCEPSAGKGGIIKHIDFPAVGAYLTCVEIQEENVNHLENEGYAPVINQNFLAHTECYDVFIANPPFSKQQDIDHVNHMIDHANEKVVSVMSKSVLWRDNAKAVEFRERVTSLGGEFISVEAGAFKESGTMVETVIVVIDL